VPTDVLAEVAALPGVAEPAARARDAIDALLWDRHVRRVSDRLARQSVLRGAWASAAMDGAEVPFDAVAAGEIEASPMGERVGRVVAMTAELPSMVEVFTRSPLQVWARLNTILAGGLAPQAEVGRPRADSDLEDPLRIGPAPLAMDAADRLTALATVLAEPTAAPGVVVAGVVHGELAVLRPFRHASGPVARGTIRLVLAGRGLDPDQLTVPESGLLTAGRSKYVAALRAYASGTGDGMAQWLTWFSGALELGARQAQRIAEGLPAA
jgi:hypothetical protein